MVPTRGRGGGGVRSRAHLSGVEAAQPRQMQLNERPEGATDALQPEQLAQWDPVQDVREQHVFPGQVQEPAGESGVDVPRPLLRASPSVIPQSPGWQEGSGSGPDSAALPRVSFSLPRPLQCSVPDSSWLLLPSGLLHWWLHRCLLRVRSKLY